MANLAQIITPHFCATFFQQMCWTLVYSVLGTTHIIYTYIHTYIHTYTHTYIHTCTVVLIIRARFAQPYVDNPDTYTLIMQPRYKNGKQAFRRCAFLHFLTFQNLKNEACSIGFSSVSFFCVVCSVFAFWVLCFRFCFFGWFRVMWGPKGHTTPNPSLSYFYLFVCFCFRFGRFRVRWGPKGPISVNPSFSIFDC